MIYTCYEMILDCRADKAEGWVHFITNYVPVIRKLLAHYAPNEPDALERMLVAIRKPDSKVFQFPEPVPERWMVAELRQKVVAELKRPTPEITLDLETVAAALEPLTVTEKNTAWFETMRYSPAEIAPMVRMVTPTAEKVRDRANELLRGKLDTWRPALLSENGKALGEEATATATKDCLSPKVFLDVLDGRMTWSGRREMETHATKCWHCIDQFCRFAEVVEVLRGVQPLTDADAGPYRKLLGVEVKKRGWF